MGDTSFASLSSTLLARKGGAKPAMRPQSAVAMFDTRQAAATLEDLGWNDMGDQQNDQGSADTVPLNPVRNTIERIKEKLEASATRSPATVVSKPNHGKKRAAFTLRLDPDRHLKLRLACTVEGKSAQALITEALDAMLASMPEIDNLAAQVSRD